jgi:(p)ppGpp synthase/HD superfamily hydrolase
MPEQDPRPAVPPSPGYSVNIDHALALAAIVHRPANRKGTQVPYVVHPVHVALILQRHGYPEAVQIAGLLHDVIEDADGSDRDVRSRLGEVFPEMAGGDGDLKEALHRLIGQRFGARVLDLVAAMTQQKQGTDGSPIPIATRRAQAVEHLSVTRDLEMVALKAADALHNTRSIVNDLRARGLPMMARFKGSPVDTLGYYLALGEVVAGQLGSTHPLADELAHSLRDLRAAFEQALDSSLDQLHRMKEWHASL